MVCFSGSSLYISIYYLVFWSVSCFCLIVGMHAIMQPGLFKCLHEYGLSFGVEMRRCAPCQIRVS